MTEGRGVTFAHGFRAGAAKAGVKYGRPERLDVALIVSERPCTAAAVFTTNQVIAAVQAWAGRLDPKDPRYEHHMMEALWVHQWHNRVNEKLLGRMLRSSEPWARAAATRVLCYWRDRVPNALALVDTQAADDHPAVRLEAVRAASFFRGPDAVALAQSVPNPTQDRFLAYTLDQAMNTLDRFIK